MAEADLITPPTLRVAVAKPKFGIYYALLIIALCAMLTACLILYLEIRRFGGFGTVKGKVAAVERSEFLLNHKGHEEHKDTIPCYSFVSFESFVVNS